MTSESAPGLLTWLVQHLHFPQHRLPPAAERLLCFAAAAQLEADEPARGSGGAVVRQDPAMAAAQRQHALRRSRVHYKCDNSAKV